MAIVRPAATEVLRCLLAALAVSDAHLRDRRHLQEKPGIVPGLLDFDDERRLPGLEILKPLLSAAERTIPAPRPTNRSLLEDQYERVRDEMRQLFRTIDIAS